MRPIDGDSAVQQIREFAECKKGCSENFYYGRGCNACAFGKIIKIVENAPTIEPYGTWIPVSSGKLPEEPEENPEFDGKPLELYLVSVNDEEYPFRAFWNGKCFTDGAFKVNAVAWMPLPKPYREEKKDEKDS